MLNLLRREVSEHGRHLQQYFNLFVMYANLGKQIALTDETVINWGFINDPVAEVTAGETSFPSLGRLLSLHVI